MNEAKDFGYRIKRISDLMQQRANAELKQVDLTFSQAKVLHYLYLQPDHTAKLKDIEKFFHVAQPTMAGIAVRLEEKDYVRSSHVPGDRRSKILILSEKGENVYRKFIGKATQWGKEIHDDFGDENNRQLCSLLDRLYEVIDCAMKEEQK